MISPPSEIKVRPLTKKEMRDEFEKWYKKPVPAQIGAYGTEHGYLIVDVFVIVQKSGLIGLSKHGGGSPDREMTYPIAKVLGIGDYFWDRAKYLDEKGLPAPCPYKVGDLVRLRDFEALVLENPRYELWRKNEYSKSNLEQIGSAPPPRILNLWEMHGKRLFSLNPFEGDMEKWDMNIFYFDMPNILMPVKRWQTLFEAW